MSDYDPFPRPLWFVARYVVDDTIRPLCALCGWMDAPAAPDIETARAQLAAHVASRGHVELVDTFRNLTR